MFYRLFLGFLGISDVLLSVFQGFQMFYRLFFGISDVFLSVFRDFNGFHYRANLRDLQTFSAARDHGCKWFDLADLSSNGYLKKKW